MRLKQLLEAPLFLVLLFWTAAHSYTVEIARQGEAPHRNQSCALIFYTHDETAAWAVRQMAETVLAETGVPQAIDNLDVFVPRVEEQLEATVRIRAKPVYHLSTEDSDRAWGDHELRDWIDKVSWEYNFVGWSPAPAHA